MSGAPIGNRNAAKAKVWTAAIERALERLSKSRTDGIKQLDALADELLKLCAAGDLNALQELGNRLEGKPAQAVELNGTLDHFIAEIPEIATSTDEWLKRVNAASSGVQDQSRKLDS